MGNTTLRGGAMVAGRVSSCSSGHVRRRTLYWSVHCGQILYAVKVLREGAFDDVWVCTMK
jgi:hypothetical protein